MEDSIAVLLRRYHYQISVFSEEDANYIIANDFQQRANQLLQSHAQETISKYGGPIQVRLHFVDKIRQKPLEEAHGLDAFVAPGVDLTSHSFYIFISMDLIRGLTSLFSHLVVGPPNSSKLLPETVILTHFNAIYGRVFSSLVFIFFHEYAHILRGHLPFLFPGQYRKGLLSLHEGIDQSPLIPPPLVHLHRVTEIDADLLALGLLNELLATKALDEAFGFPAVKLQDPIQFGESIYILMRVMEVWRQTIKTGIYDSQRAMHPHPDIRQLFIDAWLLARRQTDRGPDFFTINQQVQQGMEQAREKIDAYGDKFLPGLQYITAPGRAAALTEFETLRIHLETYLRPALLTFVAT